MTTTTRCHSALLGLVVGDCIGTSVEFRTRGSFTPLTDMIGGGPFGLAPGQFTDDSSMALCLGESLLACNGFDARDQATRYLRWWREGHWSSTGECFDIGNAVREALTGFERGIVPTPGALWGPTRENTAGNGSLMRLAPVPIYWHRDARTAIAMAGESSRVTHGNLMAIDACRYYAALIVGAINGASKDELLSPRYSPVAGLWDDAPLDARVDAIAAGSFLQKSRDDIASSGFVLHSLEAALWCFANTTSFRDAVLTAANLGDDADTTAAITGQMAGAYYGEVPTEWTTRLVRLPEINAMASALTAGTATARG